MWIARDKDGSLWIFNKKPEKSYTSWAVMEDEYLCSRINEEMFPEVTWDDSEPSELILTSVY